MRELWFSLHGPLIFHLMSIAVMFSTFDNYYGNRITVWLCS